MKHLHFGLLLVALGTLWGGDSTGLKVPVDVKQDGASFSGNLTISLAGSLDKVKAEWAGTVRNTSKKRFLRVRFCVKAFGPENDPIMAGNTECVITLTATDWKPDELVNFSRKQYARFSSAHFPLKVAKYTVTATEISVEPEPPKINAATDPLYTVISGTAVPNVSSEPPIAEVDTEFDFRRTKWCMSKEQVITIEGHPAQDTSDRLIYETDVVGSKVGLTFEFVNNKLAKAGYVLIDKYHEPNQYLLTYAKWVSALNEKYGSGKMESNWLNNLYRSDSSKYGFAISAGHLIVKNRWQTKRTEITAVAGGQNFQVSVGVVYLSKELKPELEKKATDAQKRVF
jgi:hypothetical protein